MGLAGAGEHMSLENHSMLRLSTSGPLHRAGSQNISESPLDTGASPSPEFADWLPDWHSVTKHVEGSWDPQGGEDGDGDPCPSVWGHDWQDAVDTDCAPTLILSRGWNAAVLRTGLRAQEPGVHFMNSSQLLSSPPGLEGEEHRGAADSGFHTAHFPAHLYHCFSAAMNVHWILNRCSGPETWTSG